MGSGGKNRLQRRGVGAKARSGAKTTQPVPAIAPAVFTAAYIAEMSRELRLMARAADLVFLSDLLAMAQAEAEIVAELGE